MKVTEFGFNEMCDEFDFNRMLKHRQEIVKDFTEDGLNIYELSDKYTIPVKFIRKAVYGKMRGFVDLNGK